jgi:predicted Zn-dependent protease
MFVAWLTATSFDWLYDIPGLTGMAILAAAILVVRVPDDKQLAAETDAPVPMRLVGSATAISVASMVAPTRRNLRTQVSLVAILGVLALLAASLGRQYVATLYSNSGQELVTKKPVKALHKLRTAEQLDPWSMQTQYAVASAYARLNDYAAARTVLVHAEQLEPENYVPPALLGDIATRAGEQTTALAAYRRALALDPREPTLQQVVRRATMTLQRGRTR